MSAIATVTETCAMLSSSSSSSRGDSDKPIYTLDELIKRRVEEVGDSCLLGYPREGITDYEEHSARAIDRYVDAAVVKLRELGLPPVDASTSDPPRVAILARSGLHVVITIMALSRLGYTVFLLSTRLASPALLQLLQMGSCNTILTTETFHAVLAEVQQSWPLVLKPLLAHLDYYQKDAPVFSRRYDAEKENNKIAAIIHSSGSTGFPKPIYLTHRALLAAFATNMNARALLASPLFHSHGFYETFRSIYSRKPLYYANYDFPLTGQNLTDVINVTKPDVFHCIPYMVKLLAESREGIKALATIRLVLFGGSACPDDLGDKLVAQGVNLAANYGATETGRLMNSERPAGDTDWNYLRLLPYAKDYVLFDKIADNLYECVALEGLKSKNTVNSDDPPNSFRTRDLFVPHPTRPGLWKYASRLDDRFTLINGEKVLPIPIEGRIRQDELVKEACMFGERRSFPGLLVVKADRAGDIPNDEYVEKIWPAVEAANTKAEAFSRIPRELIVVLPPDAVYPRTDKGTFIRIPFYQQYVEEINAAYENYENEDSGNLVLDCEKLEQFLHRTLKDKIGVDMSSPDAEFFAAGVDSLQCVQIWNFIRRKLDLGGRQGDLSQNVLYETGTLRKLAAYLTALRTGESSEAGDDLAKMDELIAKYSTFRPHLSNGNVAADRETVLLTGVTGGLGAHVLAQLVEKPNIAAVWVLVRAASETAAADRVAASLKARELQIAPEHLSKITAVPCDLSLPDLGLEASRLSQLLKTLTCVIHSAWAVNFNIPVQSFEDQHLRGTHNLIQLCLSVSTAKPARFYFCSSVSSAGGSPRPGFVAESQVTSPAYAQNTGYAKSKYVAEHIVYEAAKNAGVPARVLRVGQLVGDSKAGVWNATEGIPMIIQTAVTLGALPLLDENMSWLPVDYCARAIVELAELSGIERTSPSTLPDHDLVYHVLNPTPFHWSRDLIPALEKAGLEFEVLPTDHWMERMRNSDRDPSKNPPIKLLGWFESKYGITNGAKVEPLVYLTERSISDSPSLEAPFNVTDVEFVGKMLNWLKARWSNLN